MNSPFRVLLMALAATLVMAAGSATGHASCGDALTSDNDNQSWGTRHSFTSQGRVLWFDAAGVYFHDGVSASQIWAVDPNVTGHENVESFVFGLGNGAAAGEVIGVWRAGTDFAWIWRNDGNPPKLVNATNPIDANQALNPEGVAIGDGCVFIVLQAFANAETVKHVFRVDPDTGDATNLTGNAAVPGVVGRIRTDGCTAAWMFDDGTGVDKLHYYDGTSVTIIDSGGFPRPGAMAKGKLVYVKEVGSVDHVFLYDSTQATPAPVRISPDDGRPNESPHTDGYHIAWIHANPDNSFRRVMLHGQHVLNDDSSYAAANPQNNEAPLQLDRGQLLWEDAGGALRYYHDGRLDTICDRDETAFEEAWLTDGVVAAGGIDADSGADTEIFRFTGTPPNDADEPAPPMLVRATGGDGRVTLEWDTILGATEYRVYVARQAGITPGNFAGLPGGRMLSASASPFEVPCVSSAQHYFVVTTVSGADEGPASAEVAATAATGSLDTDNDGSPDCLDACPADTAKESPGACGCGRADLDSDGDGTADCVDMCPMDSVNQCNSEPMDNSNDNTAPGDDPMDNPGDPMDNPSDPMPTDEVSDGDVTGETSDVANCGDGACGVGMAGFMPFMAAGMWSTRRRRNASRS